MKRILVLVLFGVLMVSAGDSSEKLIQKAKRIHKKVLTVDSHVDTPLRLMRKDFNFAERHNPYKENSKLDIPRMKEGGLDGVFFAAFVGQSDRNEAANLQAYLRAQKIIDTIEAVVSRYPKELGIASDPKSFKKIDAAGKKAIFIGMENGYPVGTDISKIDSFYHRGVRYITLTHSYNNDICDSSTDSVEHHGLSDFGKQVVARMNKLGVMIDLSHASDETFYQVIELSDKPVIASHSCARALCDHPRNLSDEMLVSLKENGGVIQMCILSRYVKEMPPNPARDSARQWVYEKHGNYNELSDARREAFMDDWNRVNREYPEKLATVSDVVDHIDHIVEVAGIDHVGIGTDFDGGGGVKDCYDVSQLENITIELVRRGYTTKDIKKIWSGNLMRVMSENLNT